jgi:hypothetical protein
VELAEVILLFLLEAVAVVEAGAVQVVMEVTMGIQVKQDRVMELEAEEVADQEQHKLAELAGLEYVLSNGTNKK